MEKGMLSVSQLNEYLKMQMDGDRVLSSVWIRGEISNCKLYSSGHLYLTLKDEESQLKAVMFRSYASRLVFLPSNGMKIIAHGRVSVYPRDGQYQLYIDEMQPDGAGALAMRYEQLKRKLESEGLFDEARKRPLPPMPTRIGVITSPSGAAVHDIKNVLGRRFPCAEMILFPSAVQGTEAPEQLRLGIDFFSETGICDVVIIGRGGGSAEDLWAFNDEYLARAIAACSIPVISAVGHESDFTICDFVADRRAPTPSAAAELAVPDKNEILSQLRSVGARMQSLTLARLTQEKRFVTQVSQSPVFKYPERIFDPFRLSLSEREGRIERAAQKHLDSARNRLSTLAVKLDAISPLSVLARGYAAVSKDGKTLVRAAQIKCGDELQIRFSDGMIDAVVQDRKGGREDANEEERNI